MVFCTGYRQEFPFLNTVINSSSSKPYPTASDADVRDIWKRDDPTVAFIGFLRPSLGAIPPISEMQTQLWVLNLVAPHRIHRPLLPQEEPHYRLITSKTARIQYGIDHESYVYQLALDMESAPSLTEVLKLCLQQKNNHRWRLPLTWAFGANFNSKFRLCGPWKCEESAVDIMMGELWETVQRRNIFYGEQGPQTMDCSLF